MKYKCSNCSYETNIKCNYEKHLSKKKSCTIQIKDCSCPTCNKQFKHKTSVYKHIKKCSTNSIHILSKIQELETIINSQQNEINSLKKNTSNTTNIQNNENVNVFNINIYGHENKSILNHKEIVDILQKPGQWFTKYPKLLHFDSNYPENHNILQSSK